MGLSPEDRFAFAVEWLDPTSGVTWKYQLLHQPSSREIEMYDPKARRTFLKKTRYEALATEQLRPGNTVVVYGRQLRVVDYADAFTRTQLQQQQQRTCVVVKPYAVELLGDLLSALHEAGFLLQGAQLCRLTSAQARQVWQHSFTPRDLDQVVSDLSPDPIVVLDLVAEDAFRRWQAFEARLSQGKGALGDACLGAASARVALHQLEYFFSPGQVALCYQGEGTSLCLIKPHALAQGLAGPLLRALGEHFTITGLRSASLDTASANEFVEVYKGVLTGGEVSALIKELIAGSCLAVEVAGTDQRTSEDVVESLRRLCGPADPETARDLRPHTLRAIYGANKAQNAVHCTDLEEDAPLEVAFFFTLQACH